MASARHDGARGGGGLLDGDLQRRRRARLRRQQNGEHAGVDFGHREGCGWALWVPTGFNRRARWLVEGSELPRRRIEGSRQESGAGMLSAARIVPSFSTPSVGETCTPPPVRAEPRPSDPSTTTVVTTGAHAPLHFLPRFREHAAAIILFPPLPKCSPEELR